MNRFLSTAFCLSLLVAWITNCDQAYCEETEVPPFVPGSSTLVVLPDTEVYTNKNPHILQAQMRWINENRHARDILYVLHVGDVTNRNTDREWQTARDCFDMLDGETPFLLAAGNHDYDGTPGRLTYMNNYFDHSAMEQQPTFGGLFEQGKLENQYRLLDRRRPEQ